MKNILIVEPNCAGGKCLLESAVRYDFKVHAVTHKSLYDRDYDAVMKSMISSVLFTDFTDMNKCVDDIVLHCIRENIEVILPGFEFMVEIASRAAHKLNLITNDISSIRALREKDLMYKQFIKYHVPCASTAIFDDYNTCLEYLNTKSFPLIIKPSANAGSCGVSKIKSKNDVAACWKCIRENNLEFPHNMVLSNKILIQEYLEGKEYSIEIAVQNGVVNILGITEKITTQNDNFAELSHRVPGKIDNVDDSELNDILSMAVKSLGIHDSVAHVELKNTNKGIKIIEVGARMPGDRIPDLLLKATGVDEGKVFIDLAQGKYIDIEKKCNKIAMINFITSNVEGEITRIPDISSIFKRFSNINMEIEIKLYLNVGDFISMPNDNISRIGEILCVGENRDKTLEVCNSILEIIKSELVVE